MRIIVPAICLAGLAAAPALALQSEADAARAPFKACGAIADKDQRVACYDRALNESDADTERRLAAQREAEAKRKTAEFGIKPAPAAKPQRAPKPARAPQPQLAQTPPPPRPGPPADPDRVELTVARATANGLGRWTIEGSDGAIWRQTETVATFRPPAKGQSVSIQKGAIGGYLLRVGNQPYTRVERVR